MKPQRVIKAIAIDEDVLLQEADKLLHDSIPDDEQKGEMIFIVVALQTRVGWLYEHDAEQKKAVHKMTYGDDSAVQKRGLVEWRSDKAA